MKVVEGMAYLAPGVAPLPSHSAARKDARLRNLSIITGMCGRAAVREMTAQLLSFDRGAWVGMKMKLHEKWTLSLSIVCSVADAWRRLVYNFAQPNFELFQVCQEEVWHAPNVMFTVGPLLEQGSSCSQCLDPFSAQWLRRLADHRQGVSRRAFACLSDMVACLPVSSSGVERKHLLGQESQGGPKRRGRALRCATLSKVSYQKAVQQAHRKAQLSLQRRTLGSERLMRRFAQGWRGLALSGGRKRSGEAAMPDGMREVYQQNKKIRKSTAYQVFVSENCAAQPATRPIADKAQRARAAWRGLSPEQRLYYEGQAAAWSESAARVSEQGFVEFCHAEANQTMRRTSAQTLRRKAIVKTLTGMKEDPVWQSGSGLQCFESGLKPELVKGGTDKEIRSECSRMFEYDGVPKANRSQKVQAFKVCRMRHGGLCCLDPEAGRGDTLAKNAYKLIRVRHRGVAYPVFLKLSVSGAEALAEYFMLTRVIGKGELVLLVGMVRKDAGDQAPGAAVHSLKIDGVDCFPATLHMVSKQLVRRAAAYLNAPASSITAVQFTGYKYEMPDGATSMDIQLGGIIFDEPLSLVCVSHVPAKPLKVKLPFGLSADCPE